MSKDDYYTAQPFDIGSEMLRLHPLPKRFEAITDRLHLLALRQRVQLALDQLSRGQVAPARDTLQKALIDTGDNQPEAA